MSKKIIIIFSVFMIISLSACSTEQEEINTNKDKLSQITKLNNG